MVESESKDGEKLKNTVFKNSGLLDELDKVSPVEKDVENLPFLEMLYECYYCNLNRRISSVSFFL